MIPLEERICETVALDEYAHYFDGQRFPQFEDLERDAFFDDGEYAFVSSTGSEYSLLFITSWHSDLGFEDKNLESAARSCGAEYHGYWGASANVVWDDGKWGPTVEPFVKVTVPCWDDVDAETARFFAYRLLGNAYREAMNG